MANNKIILVLIHSPAKKNKTKGRFDQDMDRNDDPVVQYELRWKFPNINKREQFGMLMTVTNLPADFFSLISFSPFAVGFLFLEKTFALLSGLSLSSEILDDAFFTGLLLIVFG